MREIKFRALDKRYREMQSPHDLYISGQGDEALNMNIHDRFIFMQYTGLKDKNGVEIYEGDILRIGSSLIEEVKWVGVGDWVGAKQPMVGFISHETIYRKPIEVIGKIYENPELLEAIK